MIIEQSMAVSVPFLFHKPPSSPATLHQGFWEVLIQYKDKMHPKTPLILGEGWRILYFIFSAEKNTRDVTFYFFILEKCL